MGVVWYNLNEQKMWPLPFGGFGEFKFQQLVGLVVPLAACTTCGRYRSPR
jgi:hypothetical protein